MAIIALKIQLALGILLAVGYQSYYLPKIAHETAKQNPQLAWLHYPLLIGLVLYLACAQIAALAVWNLADKVRTKTLLGNNSRTPIVILLTTCIAATVIGIVLLSITARVNIGPAFLHLIFLAALPAGLAWLVVALRHVLRIAIEQAHELNAVI